MRCVRACVRGRHLRIACSLLHQPWHLPVRKHVLRARATCTPLRAQWEAEYAAAQEQQQQQGAAEEGAARVDAVHAQADDIAAKPADNTAAAV